MTERGDIHSVNRAKQLHDFRQLRIGNITPTDVDGLIEYRGRAFVLFELKYGDKKLDAGQELALCRLVDAVRRPGLKACLIVAEHYESNPHAVIDAAHCTVRASYERGVWQVPEASTTLRAHVFRFLGIETDPSGVVVTRVRPDDRRDGPSVDTSSLNRMPAAYYRDVESWLASTKGQNR